MTSTVGTGKSVEDSVTFAKGVSLLAGHDMDAEQEALVRAVASGEMTVDEAITKAKSQLN
ncbi:hypothetical protein HMPREF3056_11205 [Corynebacterium sp. HMSC056F09]|uniref:antitoxin VbhA family protein n=1 Tax=unclassified Corynebacterium TaxID=2624378 RepID=UPI0008A64D4D|nr:MULTISPECIES: antitoxin VbhA family protein [unclassified Corynebacterium]OFK64635.1 hypothetical protein HMPREF2807_12735 [Corynebacterium sp. HMSC074A09]OFK69757.1 hypothetical protein HMPREF2806_04715 [Corynebacterium sp. HMSC076G08]OFN75649.1 hypothetical protein HMPREF2526_11220 [Corynebacterium sp. HMSC070E08]OFO19506.1 hypothetical protein HMPREF3056_11205 [Corynebacterium sp. HMSC056F09]